MKKAILFILFISFLLLPVVAQSYSFEDVDVLDEWVAENGDNIALSSEHFKDGSKSLCWTTTGNKSLSVVFPEFLTTTANGTRMQIYSSERTNDTLIVEFYNSSNWLRRKAHFLINYKGWKDFSRKYTEYSKKNSSQDISKVKFTLKTSSQGTRKIYFDKIDFNTTVGYKRVIGKQWILDEKYLNGDKRQMITANLKKDISVQTPTQKELEDLNLIRNKIKRTPKKPSLTSLIQVRNYVDNLNLQRNSDGSIKGKSLSNYPEKLSLDQMNKISSRLEALAYDALQNPSNATITNRFKDYFDYLIDQGISEGCSFGIASNDYANSKQIPKRFLNCLDACSKEQKKELIKLVRWFSFYADMYYSEDSYKQHLNSDVVYLYLPHILASAIVYPDDNIAVRELKAFKRFLERNSEYVQGGRGILKVDGTGFHHNVHYNNYMYCYKTWVQHINYLKGTEYRISLQAYKRIKKAIVSIYRMATNDANENHFFANSLAGRNPFASGQKLFFNKSLFQDLVSIGGDCMGTKIDEDLASKYNYFYKTNFYSVDTDNQDGFYQFNYSPIGVYRKNNWVVTMKSPTSKLWGSEIYSNENRFGRYQSHGTLEVVYEGDLSNSGYPINGTGGGWDWNMPQGSTTVHYSSWKELMPRRNLTTRFDQYSKTKSFSGALAWDDCGIFSTDFIQSDGWRVNKFIPTNLRFKKSMFAFGGLIISLGSDISASGNYNSTWQTATNLFQNITSSATKEFSVNGIAVSKPYTKTLSSAKSNWFVTPTGTGYFIPKQNDDIVVNFGEQTTPKQDGSDYSSPKTTATVAKAYLKHGVKPTNKKYSFVVVPATTNEKMKSLVTKMENNGGEIYKINSQTSHFHSITYLPENITAYSFFRPTGSISFGKIKSCSSNLLLMLKEQEAEKKIFFAVCNPNLNPVYNPKYEWVSTSRTTTITLYGEWKEETQIDGVTFLPPKDGTTRVQIQPKDGEPIYFNAVKYETALNDIEKNEWFDYYKIGENLIIDFKKEDFSNRNITLFSSDGKMLKRISVNGQRKQVEINISKLGNSVKICTISNKKQTKTFRWIN